MPLLPLLTPVPWLTAQTTDGANNGLDLSDGLFRKQSDIMFPTGEMATGERRMMLEATDGPAECLNLGYMTRVIHSGIVITFE